MSGSPTTKKLRLDELLVIKDLADSRSQAADFWRLRETLPEAQLIEAVSIKHDISVPVSSVPEFLRTADAARRREAV